MVDKSLNDIAAAAVEQDPDALSHTDLATALAREGRWRNWRGLVLWSTVAALGIAIVVLMLRDDGGGTRGGKIERLQIMHHAKPCDEEIRTALYHALIVDGQTDAAAALDREESCVDSPR